MSNPLNGQISPSGGGGAATSVSDAAFPLIAPNGSIAAPSYAFSSSTDSGLFWNNGALGFSEDGVEMVAIDNSGGAPDGLRLRGGTQLTWSAAGGNPTSSAAVTGLFSANPGILRVTEGATTTSAWLEGDLGKKRLTANHTVVTNSATLAAVNDLTMTVGAGRTYSFRAILHATTVNTSGIKVALAGTATHTNIIYDVIIHGISTPSFLTSGRATAIGTAVGVTASGTACVAEIVGTTTINAGGTFLVQAAQNAETGAAESVIILRGSTFLVQDLL